MILFTSFLTAEIILVIQLVAILMKRSVKLNRGFIAILIVVFLHGLLNSIIANNDYYLLFRQIIGITISFVFYDTYAKNNLIEIFGIYKKLSVFIAFFSIIQQLAKILNIPMIYDLRWLIHSQLAPNINSYRSSTFFAEPSVCALFIIPIVFMGIYRVFGKHKQQLVNFINMQETIILFIGFFFIFSSVGYLGVLIGLGLIFLEYKHTIKQLAVFISILLSAIILYNYVDLFKIRVDDVLLIFTTNSFENTNLSSQTLMINANIAWESIKNTLGFGSGLGSHFVSYQKYIGEIGQVYSSLNQEDANSLFLRIISDFGVFGGVFLTWFIIKYKVKKMTSSYYFINLASLVYISLRLIRYGHYFDLGLWFFVIAYYYSYCIEKQNITNKEEVIELF